MIKLFIKSKITLFFLSLAVFAFFSYSDNNSVQCIKNAEASLCKGPADVVLVIDRSSTMANSSKFDITKTASVGFINELFATDPDPSYGECAYHQIGLVAFNNNIDSESLNQSGSFIQSIINQSDGILGNAYPIGYRRTSSAIDIAKNKLDSESSNANACATKTMIVLTDGSPDYDIDLAKANADLAKAKGIRIVSVGLKLDEITNPAEEEEAENFIKNIASTFSDCYYTSDFGNTLDYCTSISGDNLEVILTTVYNSITDSICDEIPPVLNIHRTPQGTLYNVDELLIKSIATDITGFKSHNLIWSDNWPDDLVNIECANLSGTEIECDTEAIGPFSSGKILNYRSMAVDANDNEGAIDDPNPRAATVATVSLDVPNLFRNTDNTISVDILDPNGKADFDDFYITIDTPALGGVEIEKATMNCSGSGSERICVYSFNPGCDWTNGITDGFANNIDVNIYIYADSDDMDIRQIASTENQSLASYFEGPSLIYPGTCSDEINNNCNYINSDPNQPIIDSDEISCDTENPLISNSRAPSGDVYDDDSILLTSDATDDNGIKQHIIYYKENSGARQTAFDCNDTNVDSWCDEDASQSITNISATIGPFIAGTQMRYRSMAIDYSGNNNEAWTEPALFTIKSRECEGVGDLGACLITPGGKCCGGVCNVAISNPDSYNVDYCAMEMCNGTSWRWGIDYTKNDITDCSDDGNSDGCYPYGIGGCEDRDYSCGDGYCVASTTNQNGDECIGLDFYDYECNSGSCDFSVFNNDPRCDVILDNLSINAYNSDDVLIVGSSSSLTNGEVLNNLTNKVSLNSVTSDTNGISEQKIYWKKSAEIDFSIENCDVSSCGDTLNPCDCSKDIGAFNAGEIIEFYASSKDDSVNQTEEIEGSSNGLRYYYYDGTNFDVYKGSDVDTDIDHHWSGNQVIINSNSWEDQYDSVSIVWDGLVSPDVLGEHIFYVSIDDGMRLYLDGNLVIDKWFSQTTEYYTAYDFTSLEPISIRIEWYEGYGSATMRLGWDSPNGSKVYPIPSDNLVAPYSFVVRNGECYDVPGGNRPDLTFCDSGNGRCCGGVCDSSQDSNPYDSECSVDTCNGTDWIYEAGNENNPCGSSDTCFDYYSPNNLFYSGCITGGNKCSSGYCAIASSLTSTPACSGNLLTNYSCNPDNATGTCQVKDTNIDCSIVGDYDNDSASGGTACNCDCDNYDLEEKVYSSLNFDGVDDYAYISDSSTMQVSSYTVSVWIKPSLQNEFYSGIIGKPGRNYNMWLLNADTDNTGYIHHRFHDDSSWNSGCLDTPAGSVPTDVWTNVTITNDGVKCRTYINGVESTSGDVSGSLVVDPGITYIGRNLDGNSEYYFKGNIDDARIYNRALYPEEVLDHHNGIFADDTGLVGHWDFDEETGVTVNDISSNNNNGILENGPQWMKHYHESPIGNNGNVPENWQVCTDGKDNDCDGTSDNYNNDDGISNCDGEIDGVSVKASAENRDGVKNDNLFGTDFDLTIDDVDIERTSNDFTITANATDYFLIRQIVIEWTNDNWISSNSKECEDTGICKVCIEGGTCGEGNDLIPSSSLSAGNTFNFRVCAWDNSVNNNQGCTEYHGITILNSNIVPEITPLSFQEPDFCDGNLSYILKWNFSDPDGDGQSSYEIEVKEGNNDFTDNLTVYAKKYPPDPYLSSYYQILSGDFVNDNEMEYNKTYYWRIKVTDNRGGGYEQSTDWIEGPSFDTPEYKYPQVDFSAISDHSGNCLYGFEFFGAENRCDFGEDITFSDDCENLVECTSSNNKQCLSTNFAKCNLVNNLCVSCEDNSECVKFNSPNVSYSCNIESGICEASGSCLTSDDCKAVDIARCDTGVCILCDDDSQCTNSKFGTVDIDYFCNSSGKCEDRESRRWYFYDSININSNDPNPVNNYINSSVDTYIVTLKIKDVLGNICSKRKNIFLGGMEYPRWNEMPPSN
ncbi:MAG: LamG-like jellyroll fold domain-containing protein [Patescibacteria group bacterium]|nr:LamG-like jellyroll fold domain-containing protein [Patescibacteria group bacterium]